MIEKQADYVNWKSKTEKVTGEDQMYLCESSHKEKSDSDLCSYEDAILNDIELFNVHTESAEIEKWPILSRKVDNVKNGRKTLPANRVKFKWTEGIYLKGTDK